MSTGPLTRTTALPIVISIVPGLGGGGGNPGGDGDEADAIISGTNESPSSPGSGDRARAACLGSCGVGAVPAASLSTSRNSNRASRRHAKSCCGESPLRRATSDTLVPGAKLSTTMRALSVSDQRRRRSDPVISSIRRTPVPPCSAPSALLLSLRSSVMSK